MSADARDVEPGDDYEYCRDCRRNYPDALHSEWGGQCAGSGHEARLDDGSLTLDPDSEEEPSPLQVRAVESRSRPQTLDDICVVTYHPVVRSFFEGWHVEYYLCNTNVHLDNIDSHRTRSQSQYG